jgi:hypothetical protein
MLRIIIALIFTAALHGEALPDSVKDTTTAVADSVTFKFGIGVITELIIPSSPLFTAMRSVSENSIEADGMLQDAEEKFSNNDVTLSLGFSALYRAIPGWQFTGTASWFGFENGNSWSPKAGDTAITTTRANRYRLDCVRIGIGVQKNLPEDFLTAEGYARLYISAGVDGYPLVRLKTERTALGGKRVGYGRGFGYRIGLGAEKRISDKTLFLGEIMYGNSQVYETKDVDRTTLESDVLRSGKAQAVKPELKTILFELKIVRGLF